MPAVVHDCASLGYATDDSIYKHLGHLIGPPSRGLPGAVSLCEITQEEPQHVGIVNPEELVQPVAQRLLVPRLNPPESFHPAKMSLQNMAFTRWRASFWTKDNIMNAMAMQSRIQQEKEDLKTAKATAARHNKEVAAIKRAEREQERKDREQFGPRRRIKRISSEPLCCECCLENMPIETADAADDWQTCDTCDGRWFCTSASCVLRLNEHEVLCSARKEKMEKEYQEIRLAAPRVGLESSKRKSPGGGAGRGKGPKT